VNLLRSAGRPLVIGHRGARAVAPENTLAGLEAAVAAGADLVEFDVSPGLQVAHSTHEVPASPIDLDTALEYLRAHEVGVHLDVKLPGYEADVVALVRRHALDDRAVLSTAWPRVARRFARLAPGMSHAIGYPRDTYGVARVRWPAGLTRAGAAALRAAMPARIPLLLRQAGADTLALHHTLCSRAAVAAAHRGGAPVLAWTVNDPAAVRRLAALGVDAIVSDDPGMALATLSAP
jgi:glycerophosphoryl diester phosphodiesterase